MRLVCLFIEILILNLNSPDESPHCKKTKYTHSYRNAKLKQDSLFWVCSTEEGERIHFDLATIPVAMGRLETVPISVTMTTGEVVHTGLVYSMNISSHVCEPATKHYESLLATGQETH